MTKPGERGEYVLGTGDDEWSRLQLQHRLWSDAAVDAWKRAGIGGEGVRRILDIGCGPGHAAFDLAQLVGSGNGGRVVGVDESEGFIEGLNKHALARGLTWLKGVQLDVQKLGEPAVGKAIGGVPGDGLESDAVGADFDAAYARWVLCFVSNPDAVMAGVAKRLRTGGRLVVHDYFNYTSMTTAPRSAWFDALVQATAESWRERGGDPDIVARLPAMLARHGLIMDDLRVHLRVARGGLDAHGRGDPMLQWPVSWWRTYGPKLVAMGKVKPETMAEAHRGLDELVRDPTRFVVCPPVFEIIATKR